MAAEPIGRILQRARSLSGTSLDDAARDLGLSARRLRRVERGSERPTTELVDTAVGLYGSDLDLVPRQDLVSPELPGVLVIGSERISVDLIPLDNRTVLVRYLAAVRRQRDVPGSDPVELRSSDIVALAAVLDLAAGDLERELRELAGLSRDRARNTALVLVLTGLAAVAVGASALLGGTAATTGTNEAAAPPPAVSSPTGSATAAEPGTRALRPTTGSPSTVERVVDADDEGGSSAAIDGPAGADVVVPAAAAVSSDGVDGWLASKVSASGASAGSDETLQVVAGRVDVPTSSPELFVDEAPHPVERGDVAPGPAEEAPAVPATGSDDADAAGPSSEDAAADATDGRADGSAETAKQQAERDAKAKAEAAAQRQAERDAKAKAKAEAAAKRQAERDAKAAEKAKQQAERDAKAKAKAEAAAQRQAEREAKAAEKAKQQAERDAKAAEKAKRQAERDAKAGDGPDDPSAQEVLQLFR